MHPIFFLLYIFLFYQCYAWTSFEELYSSTMFDIKNKTKHNTAIPSFLPLHPQEEATTLQRQLLSVLLANSFDIYLHIFLKCAYIAASLFLHFWHHLLTFYYVERVPGSLPPPVSHTHTHTRAHTHLTHPLSRWFIRIANFFLSSPAHGIQKFLGQESNLHHSSDLRHKSDNSRSLTCWATRELPVLQFLLDQSLQDCDCKDAMLMSNSLWEAYIFSTPSVLKFHHVEPWCGHVGGGGFSVWKLISFSPRASLELAYNILPPVFSFWKHFDSHRGPPGQLPTFSYLSYFLSLCFPCSTF